MYRYKNYVAIDRKEEVKLFKRVESGDIKARNELVERNMGLVIKFGLERLKQHLGHIHNMRYFDDEDLFQWGMIGLIKAVDKYDWVKGYAFSTYAYHLIREHISRGIEESYGFINTPVSTSNKGWELRRKYDEPVPLESCTYKDIDGELYNPEDLAVRIDLRKRIWHYLDKLNDREAKVIKLRFGLEDGRARSLEETGKEFNVTRERIRQVESKALSRLKKNKEIDELLWFFEDGELFYNNKKARKILYDYWMKPDKKRKAIARLKTPVGKQGKNRVN